MSFTKNSYLCKSYKETCREEKRCHRREKYCYEKQDCRRDRRQHCEYKSSCYSYNQG